MKLNLTPASTDAFLYAINRDFEGPLFDADISAKFSTEQVFGLFDSRENVRLDQNPLQYDDIAIPSTEFHSNVTSFDLFFPVSASEIFELESLRDAQSEYIHFDAEYVTDMPTFRVERFINDDLSVDQSHFDDFDFFDLPAYLEWDVNIVGDESLSTAENSSPNPVGAPGSGGSSEMSVPGSTVFDLADLNGSNGFVLNGIDASDSSGGSVSSAGDVNGDGYGDIIIGAFGADTNGNSNAGESYVIFGQASGFAASLDLSTLNGVNGFVLSGIDSPDRSGVSVSRAGDVNGDGYDDVIIGAFDSHRNGNYFVGESYVVFGQAGGFGASLNLATLNGSNGFVLTGIDTYDQSGFSVSSAGDMNGDGYDDIIIGARSGDPNGNSGAGESYVVFGQAGGFGASLNLSTLNGSNGFVLNGIDASDSSGYSVSGAGDMNGDGYDDIIIGARRGDPNGNSGAGESYVVFGQAGGFGASLNLSTLNGNNGFVLNGIDASDSSGYSVSSAGDVNGDGYDDIIIGANSGDPNGNSNAGESYVVFGQAGGFAASFDLSTLNGSNGFVINGIDTSDFSGTSVSSAGDFNGDGYDDILIGAADADPNGNSNAGESYVVFGQASGFAANLDLSTLNGGNGFVLNGIVNYSFTGTSVSSAGDVNGDGYDDIIIGASNAAPNGNSGAGESYVIFGSADFGPPPIVVPLVPDITLAEIFDGDLSTITAHLANFSEAAYNEASALQTLEDDGWTLYSEENAAYFFGLGELGDIETIDGRPPFSLIGENIITSGNAELILGRTNEALVISFTGTNEVPDVIDWVTQYDLVEHLLPIMNRILSMVEEDDSITEVYFTGHSLGAAMAEIFYSSYQEQLESVADDFGVIRGLEVHGQNFASPGFNQSAIDEAATFVLGGVGSLLLQGVLQSLLDTLQNTNSPFLSTWVDGDIIRAGSFLSDNIGQPFEIFFSSNSASGGPVSRHSQDLYADVISQVDIAISSNSIIESGLIAQGLLGQGDLFSVYDGVITRADYVSDNNWIIGDQISSFSDTDFLIVSVSRLNDTHIIIGNEGTDIIVGGRSSDLIFGLGGDDTIQGDSEFAIAGYQAPISPDIIDGGEGIDTVSYRYIVGVEVYLFNSELNAGGALGDSLYSIENIIGSESFDDIIYGDNEANRLEGLGGSDELYGQGGDDILIADSTTGVRGTDYIRGGTGNDSLYTEGGFDTLEGGDDNDIYYIGELPSADRITIFETQNDTNNDRIILDAAYDRDDVAFSYVGNDLILTITNSFSTANGFIEFGIGSFDILISDGANIASIESIVFASGDASINLGLALADYNNGVGSDINDYFIAESGGQILSGAGGLDTVNLSQVIDIGSPSPASQNRTFDTTVQASNGASGLTVLFTENGLATVSAANVSDITLIDVENVILSDFDDSFFGDDENNTITAGLGNDEIYAGGGNDSIIEASGGGDDIYDGQGGTDLVNYSSVESALIINLDAAVDHATGADIGTDQLISIESVLSGQGEDELSGNSSNNYFDSGFGDDLIRGRDGDDVLFGNNGDDTIIGGSGADVIDGGAGIDTASYIDAVSGVVAYLSAGAPGTGDAAGDIFTSIENVEGSAFNDLIVGDSMSNGLSGLSGNDTLNGMAGDDVLNGGGGGDVLDGGAGMDTADYAESTNRVLINMATDSITSGHATGDTFISIENVTGTNFGDTITGDGDANIISGGNGFDVLSGFNGDDTLEGDAGRDFLNGGAGADIIDGGSDLDMARYVGSNAGVNVDLGAGTASGGHADGDILIDIEQLFGSSHADVLTGDAQNNFIFGSGGDDILDGAGGIDKLFGGSGADTFVFGAGDGFAYVTDWEDDIDSLDLTQYGFSSVADAMANMDQRGDHVRFFVDGETLLILNADLDDLADDIIVDGATI